MADADQVEDPKETVGERVRPNSRREQMIEHCQSMPLHKHLPAITEADVAIEGDEMVQSEWKDKGFHLSEGNWKKFD